MLALWIVLLVALLVCLSPLFDRIWQLVPARGSSGNVEKAAWLSFALILLATGYALFGALTFSLGSHSTTGGSLARWGLALLGGLGCTYVWNCIDRARTRD